ncbi:MAG TPA: molybdenum cofactor guanylyltransferase [Candidatus Binatia bacterium]|nr:molybdenum cofactor guanylyltransferase [Candidatus Binatia bacterium]
MDSAPAVVLLAGGEATRFPGKLEHRLEGRPMVAHLYERVRALGTAVYIAGNGSFSRETDAMLDAPLIVDRKPRRGPAEALLSACALVRADRIFALAADQPNLDAGVLERLRASWQSGDEAVVPEHDGRIEPLAALYDRRALLREGFELLRGGDRSMRALVARVAARFVAFEGRFFHNVNRSSDLP